VKTAIERRKEDRAPAQGTVILILQEKGQEELKASLLDVSRNGFRASYEHRQLSPGLELDFTHLTASGRARVVWTRILGEQAESGFLVIG
jgi:hypothetical protein